MNNEIKINVPEGMEIDRENSTLECIRFKPKKKELPKTWEEFCENNPIKPNEVFITNQSNIAYGQYCPPYDRDCVTDVNLFPSKEYAEAMLALCKLIQLRDCYNDGWEPNWKSAEPEYVIRIYSEAPYRTTTTNAQCLLVFKTLKLRDEFYNNFKDLIEQAKLLL